MPDQDITEAVAEARDLLRADFRPDVFEVIRTTSVDDGVGGILPGAPVTVMTGPCTLRIAGTGGAGQAGQERAIADKMGWATAYAVDLDPDVIVSPSDSLIVNGRTMQIGGVARGGIWAVEQTIICQERG